MFYCYACAEKNSWPKAYWEPLSRGACEMCGKVANCFDVPSSALPVPVPSEPQPAGTQGRVE